MTHSLPPAPRPPEPVPRRAMRKAQHDEILGFLTLIVGVALFAGPLLLRGHVAARDAWVNEYLLGLLVVFLAARRMYRGGGPLADGVILVAGGWLIASPFVLGLGDTAVSQARVFDVTLGIVLVVLAAVSLLLLRAARKAPPGSVVRPPTGGGAVSERRDDDIS